MVSFLNRSVWLLLGVASLELLSSFSLVRGFGLDPPSSSPWKRFAYQEERRVSSTATYPRRRGTFLSALIYGADGKLVKDEEVVMAKDDGDASSSSLLQSLMKSVSTASLARVASAFAPQLQQLEPQQLTSVAIVRVDAQHVELAVSVPSDAHDDYNSPVRTCVQLLVPVALPNPCSSKTIDDSGDTDWLTECILKNLQQLDELAEKRLEQRQREQEQQEHLQLLLPQLRNWPDEDCNIPTWWIVAPSDLSAECDHLKSLLNEDEFMDELRQLAVGTMSTDEVEKPPRSIAVAQVATIGPAGLLLRMVDCTTNVPNDDDIVNVFVAFDQPVSTAEELRNNVLDRVEQASSFTVETPLQTTLDDDEKKTGIRSSDKEQRSQDEELLKEEEEEDHNLQLSRETENATIHNVEEEMAESVQPAIDKTSDEAIRVEFASNQEFTRVTQKARQQPKEPKEEARLAQRYASISDVGERAFAILKDLYMI